jgi:STE24 endopeptidase
LASIFSEEQVARARRYHRPLYAAAITAFVLDLAVLAVIVFGGLGDRLSAPLDGRPWWASVLGLTALVACARRVVGLPISFWAGFVRERGWGFSTQSLRGWTIDLVKGFGVVLVLTAAGLSALVGSARFLPSAWPAVAAPGVAALVLTLAFAAPVVIEPLFNRFTPLEDAALTARLQELAARGRVPVKEVLVADASRRTRKVNAYVSGFGETRRLVLYDTLIARSSPAELGLVLAHRRALHVIKGTLLGMTGAAAFVVLLWGLLCSPGLRAAVGAPGGAADPRVVPFVLLLAAVVEILAAPLGAALSRRWEREADRFSLGLTRDLATFESAHRSLAAANLSDLDPPRTIYLLFFTHPTPLERIESARRLSVRAESATPLRV